MAESISRKSALAVIEEQLTPFIGASMARSSVKLHSQKLGLESDELDRTQVETLLTQVGLAMRVFVGADKADALVRSIFASLFAEDSG